MDDFLTCPLETGSCLSFHSCVIRWIVDLNLFFVEVSFSEMHLGVQYLIGRIRLESTQNPDLSFSADPHP